MATRVALISPPLDASGGVGRMMSYVVPACRAQDVEIRLLDTRGRSRRPALSIFPLMGAWARLVVLGLARRIDVAHINMSSHGSTIRKATMLWTCRLLRVPIVLHLHSGYYPEFFANASPIVKAFLRRTFAGADVVIVLGGAWRDFVCGELGVPVERVTLLPSGAPGPEIFRGPLPRGREPLKILFLGRVNALKGVPEMLAALASPGVCEERWTARLVGDGDHAPHRREAERLGIADRVDFCGWVDTVRAQQLLAESHLLLLPSHAEGLPMVLIEAFAHGLPVISTPVGAIPDILDDGLNGLLVRPRDSAQLAEAIARILRDESLRSRLAENARRTWEERLNIASYVRRLIACWHRLSAPAEVSPVPVRFDL